MKSTRSEALKKILAESLDDYKNLTAKDVYISLGPDKFRAYFDKICSDSLNYYFNFDKNTSEISLTKKAVEYSALLSTEDNVGVFDYDVQVTFSINSGNILVKVVAQYDVEYTPVKQYKTFNVNKSAQESVTISANVKNLKAAIDNAFDAISDDKEIQRIEFEFQSYVDGNYDEYSD